MRKTIHPRMMSGIGISSLIIVFVALSISIFSVLTLLTVRQDLESSRINAQNRASYYAADTRAVEKLAELEKLCGDSSVIDFSNACRELGVSVKTEGRGQQKVIFSWSENINSAVLLECSAVFSDSALTVTKWTAVNKSSYINNGSLPVWDGGKLPQK